MTAPGCGIARGAPVDRRAAQQLHTGPTRRFPEAHMSDRGTDKGGEMIKATGMVRGKKTLFVGLSFGNLDKFHAAPLDSFISIKGDELGLPFDVFIFSGRTEADMADLVMANGFGPDTKVHISKRLKQ